MEEALPTFVEVDGAVLRNPFDGQPIGTRLGVAVEDPMGCAFTPASRQPPIRPPPCSSVGTRRGTCRERSRQRLAHPPRIWRCCPSRSWCPPQDTGAVFFAFQAANDDGESHFNGVAANAFGIEDLRGGGDRDDDDQIVRFWIAN